MWLNEDMGPCRTVDVSLSRTNVWSLFAFMPGTNPGLVSGPVSGDGRLL